MKRKTMDLSTFAFCALIILSILFVVSNYLASGVLAKYLSKNSSTDDATVAKWEINFEDKDALNIAVPSTHLEYGSKGEWGLNIINKSEVLAKLASYSEITFTFSSPKFDPESNYSKWDYLVDGEGNTMDNPVNFRIYYYNCSLQVLNDYYLTDGVFDNSIQQEGMNVQQHLILDTDTTDLTFTKIVESEIFFYETSINVGELDALYNIKYDKESCIRVVWDVDVPSPDYNLTSVFNTYHLIEASAYDNTKYTGIVNKSNSELINLKDTSLSSSDIETFKTNNIITINATNYLIAYKENDAFEYAIYASKSGGEVNVTLDDGSIKKGSKLTSSEITSLQSRTISSVTDLNSLNKFIEKLEYNECLNYLEVKSQYEAYDGYFGLGIQCEITLDLRVEQVD